MANLDNNGQIKGQSTIFDALAEVDREEVERDIMTQQILDLLESRPWDHLSTLGDDPITAEAELWEEEYWQTREV